MGIGLVSGWTARMWVRTEIGVTTACVRNMGVDLGRAQIRVTQHLLDRAEVGAPFEEMGGKRMAEQVRMHARRIESGLCGQPAKDEKRAGPGQSTPLRVEEKLRAMPAVQERPSSREVAAHGLDSFASKRHDPLLVTLAEAPYDAVLQVDPAAVEPHCLAHPEPGAVEELDESPIPERAGRRPVRGLDQALNLAGRKRAGEPRAAPREVELRRRVVLSTSEKDEVVVERARRGRPSDDGRRGLAAASQICEPSLQVVRARTRGRPAEIAGEVCEIAPVGINGPRRPARGEERQEALDLGVRREDGPGRRRA